MPDDVLINKAATVERCVARAREEFARDPATLNVQRACDVLDLMAKHRWIDNALAE